MHLVTGGAGFIGSNIVHALEARGVADLVVVDRLGTDEKWRNIAKRDLFALISPEALPAFLEENRRKIRAIIHMGAISATTERDADLIAETNLRLSQYLWDWSASHGARLIYASSAATYGDGAEGFNDDDQPEALAKLRPMNAYGWSKHAFDRWVVRGLRRGAMRPSQWAGLKFFNVYGPNEYHKGGQMSVVAQLHPLAAEGKPCRLFRSHNPDYEDGGQLRDFIWVGDCIDVILWLLDNPEVSGLFNVGTGRARSFRDLANAVYRANGREPMITYIDTPEAIRDRYQYFTEARLDRLRAAGYPGQFTSLEDGVSRYVQDFLAKPDPYL